MRVFVFVNSVQEIGFRQTTALLIAALHRHGLQVFLADVDGLSIRDQRSGGVSTSVPSVPALGEGPSVVAHAIRFECPASKVSSQTVAEVSQAAAAHRESIELSREDLILIRTNPGRDQNRRALHANFLDLCQVASATGVRVSNHPARLAFFASKAAVALLPQPFRPQMLVSRCAREIASFVATAESECVIKPLIGSRGENVIRTGGNPNQIQEIIATKFDKQNVVVQEFVQSAEPGDKRVVVFDGKLLTHKHHFAGIHRIPAAGDFRANLHAGGVARPLGLTPQQQEAATTAAELLLASGIRLAGIDLIGNRVIEFNVFSTGGLYDANRFADFDFANLIASQLAESGRSC